MQDEEWRVEARGLTKRYRSPTVVWTLARAESVAINSPRRWLVVFGCLAMVLVVQYVAHRVTLVRTAGTGYAIEPQEQAAVQRLGLSPL